MVVWYQFLNEDLTTVVHVTPVRVVLKLYLTNSPSKAVQKTEINADRQLWRGNIRGLRWSRAFTPKSCQGNRERPSSRNENAVVPVQCGVADDGDIIASSHYTLKSLTVVYKPWLSELIRINQWLSRETSHWDIAKACCCCRLTKQVRSMSGHRVSSGPVLLWIEARLVVSRVWDTLVLGAGVIYRWTGRLTKPSSFRNESGNSSSVPAMISTSSPVFQIVAPVLWIHSHTRSESYFFNRKLQWT